MINFSELSTTKSCEGLVPVIIQDNSTLKVLMLGYMNEEALEKSQAEGRVTFFSRTKNRLWTKGETSGNYLNICSIAKDCDDDTLLIRVDPIGPTCHKGTTSCFGGRENEGFIGFLDNFIHLRHKQMPEGSYTTHLFNKGINKIAQKVGEEAVETVIEAIDCNDERLLYEAADLMYHYIVLLASKGMSLADIEEELAKRHK